MFWGPRSKFRYFHSFVDCEPVPDALTLQEFGTRSTSDATISSRLNVGESGGRNTRKGYHRLEGEGPEDITVLQQQPPPLPLPPTSYSRMSAHNPEECIPPSSGSSESSSDNERDYFEGFTDSDDENQTANNPNAGSEVLIWLSLSLALTTCLNGASVKWGGDI
ncbi:hypothetical protein AVEN_133568-1 [Araneus ventricosus]|uniref:Uncharacterized protein n=1 Tax=Araneus ventricosus TaxID=182803 RepID=A0A4Y2I8G2_ARAVE|nr:hypothetical protein AVEN_133568-1 [Araneus ventricosus]